MTNRIRVQVTLSISGQDFTFVDPLVVSLAGKGLKSKFSLSKRGDYHFNREKKVKLANAQGEQVYAGVSHLAIRRFTEEPDGSFKAAPDEGVEPQLVNTKTLIVLILRGGETITIENPEWVMWRGKLVNLLRQRSYGTSRQNTMVTAFVHEREVIYLNVVTMRIQHWGEDPDGKPVRIEPRRLKVKLLV